MKQWDSQFDITKKQVVIPGFIEILLISLKKQDDWITIKNLLKFN